MIKKASLIKESIILGIDPGTHRMGYGVISISGRKTRYIDCGVVETRSVTTGERLLTLYKELSKIIDKHKPEAVGIEKLFFAKNQKTAMSVAEARGIALLAAAEAKVPILEVSPTTVKQYVTGYGGADKKAMIKMVKIVLGLEKLEVLDDATDALGIAIAAAFLR